MKDLDLFAADGQDAPAPGAESPGVASGGGTLDAPLAARMRPRTLEAFQGQKHLLGPGRPLALMIERGMPPSMILWGPPGSGKTTLARLLAERAGAAFVPFSAVTEGIARVREIIAEARERQRASGRRTILFCDEIHRFNRAQQDAFLPHVEEGSIVLIGATTENPSFEIIRPLLSRAPVMVLEPLAAADLVAVLERALAAEEGLAREGVRATGDALDLIAGSADGDARRALGALESAASLVGPGGLIDAAAARDALQHRHALYDKGGEEHYNLVSALHKAIRGGDPDGALYWLARMLHGGEDPLYLARRLVRIAAEDVGLADPQALPVTLAARDAYHFLGSPEGELALAEAAVYLAGAPKSNRIYLAWQAAADRARETPSEPVPLHLRNAPTGLLRELGYGDGYRYDPDEPGGVAAQRYLPPRLEGARFYRPSQNGFEAGVAARLAAWARLRAGGSAEDLPGGHPPPPPPGPERGRGSRGTEEG